VIAEEVAEAEVDPAGATRGVVGVMIEIEAVSAAGGHVRHPVSVIVETAADEEGRVAADGLETYTFPVVAHPDVVVDGAIPGLVGRRGLAPDLCLLGRLRQGPARAHRALTEAGGRLPDHAAHHRDDAHGHGHDPDLAHRCPDGMRSSGAGPRAVVLAQCPQTVALLSPSVGATRRQGAGVGVEALVTAEVRPERRAAIADPRLHPHLGTRGRAVAHLRGGRDVTAGAALAVLADAGVGLAVGAAALASQVRTTAGAGRRGVVPLRGGGDSGTAVTTTARGSGTGAEGPLLHLRTLLHGTDQLMVQALKTDLDLPVTTRRRRMPDRYVKSCIVQLSLFLTLL